MKPLVLRNGLVDTKLLREVQRPLELDLEAAFKQMREDVTRKLLEAVREGDTPDEAIRRIDMMLAED